MRSYISLILFTLAILNTFSYAQQNFDVLKDTLAVKSALHSAFWGVDLNMKNHKHPNCPTHEITKVEVFDYKHEQTKDPITNENMWCSKWYEIWTVNACNDEFKIKIDFFQTQKDESTCKMKVISKNGKSLIKE